MRWAGREGLRLLRNRAIFVTLNLFQGPAIPTLRFMWDERQPSVYILASRPRGTLYIGVTSHLLKRLWQHRSGTVPGFTSRHHVHRLVRFELFGDMERAILREKQLKRWHRDWKITLIEGENSDWHDLAPALGLPPLAPCPRRDGS